MSVLDGPGEGTWSVFAQQVVEARDALREEVAQLHVLVNNATKLAHEEGDARAWWQKKHAEDTATIREALSAHRAVHGGEACADERAKGNDRCAACAWCCAFERSRADGLQRQLDACRRASKGAAT